MVETTSTTNTLTLPVPGALKRCALIGTAQSWARCPWQDQTLEVWGLNDAYLIGVPRADRWYDLHPFHQMAFRPKDQRTVRQQDVPIGAYLRPDGHLDWLRTRPMPVYLAEARPDFPTARAFPQAEILEWFKPYWPYRLTRHGRVEPGPDYEVSTPAWMLMHAIVEGYGEIHVYGIHLATQWEYVQQRPNFEFLLGLAAGRGIKIVLPQAAPICQARYRYAFEPKADLPIQSAQLTIDQIKAEGLALHQQRVALPWYARGRKQDVARQLARADLLLADARQQLTRAQIRQMA